ncbi:MAG: transcription initiation factor IIB family protein [Conexivisphaerales archaeon]
MLSYVDSVASRLNIPDNARDEAKDVLRIVLQSGRKQFVAAAVASCLYLACKKYQLPITMQEIGNAVEPKVNRHIIGRKCTSLYRLLYSDSPPKTMPPEAYVYRIASALKCSHSVVQHSLELIRWAKAAGSLVSGKHPAVIAAAALYLSAMKHGDALPQAELASKAGLADSKSLRRVIAILEKVDVEHP